MEQNQEKEQQLEIRTHEIEQLIASQVGIQILRYAKNDKANKIPIRPDRMADNISRVLRSKKAMRLIVEKTPSIESKLLEFREQWNKLIPLYPNQAETLRRHHSSGGNLEHENAKRLTLRVIGDKSDSELWNGSQWLSQIEPRILAGMIKKLYREREEQK